VQHGVGDLLKAAHGGDALAWTEIVDRFERVVWATTYGFNFDEATRSDVFQLTWLRLLDNLDRIRNPERLAGWLATTARRECLTIVRQRNRTQLIAENEDQPANSDPLDQRLLDDELGRALASAFDALDVRCRELLRLVLCEPPLGYAEVSEMLAIPIGSIGPTRRRCLDRLRAHPAMVQMRDEARGPESREA